MKLYYTGVLKEGEPQANPVLSLGGYVSSSPLPNGSINNLFGGISQYGKEKQLRQVRAIVLRNETGATATPTVWYENISSEPITNYRFGFVMLAQDECGWYMERIGSGDALPINATLINPNTEVNAVALPPMANNAYIGIWVERTYNRKAIADSQSCENMLAKWESSNEYQVSTIQFVADVANSLDGKSFNLDTKEERYMIWFSTGAGATQPTSVGREPIRVTIATNDTATDVANKVNNQLGLLIVPRGEVESTVNADTVTITSSEYGSFQMPADVDAGITATKTVDGTFNGMEGVENLKFSISY